MTLAFTPVDPVEDILFRLAHFRRVAFGTQTDFEAELCEWFGILARQARILAILYASRSSVDRDTILRRADVAQNTLKHDLTDLRHALGDGSISVVDGGCQLTQAGRAACDEAVANVGLGYLRGRLVA